MYLLQESSRQRGGGRPRAAEERSVLLSSDESSSASEALDEEAWPTLGASRTQSGNGDQASTPIWNTVEIVGSERRSGMMSTYADVLQREAKEPTKAGGGALGGNTKVLLLTKMKQSAPKELPAAFRSRVPRKNRYPDDEETQMQRQRDRAAEDIAINGLSPRAARKVAQALWGDRPRMPYTRMFAGQGGDEAEIEPSVLLRWNSQME